MEPMAKEVEEGDWVEGVTEAADTSATTSTEAMEVEEGEEGVLMARVA